LPRAQNSTADDLNRRSPERRAVVAQEDGRHVLAYSGHGVVRRYMSAYDPKRTAPLL